jgi:hypothetical protein
MEGQMLERGPVSKNVSWQHARLLSQQKPWTTSGPDDSEEKAFTFTSTLCNPLIPDLRFLPKFLAVG